jgi:DNA segregation ATPase FtsK/SpoIIIE, S-DNA-T family
MNSSSSSLSLLGWCSRERPWLIALALQIYITLVLVTYHPHDPAWSQAGSIVAGEHIHNAGGELGAWLSDLGFSLFGYSLLWWVVAGWAFLLGYYYFRRREEAVPQEVYLKWSGGFILLLIGSCGLEALYQFRFSEMAPQGAGGVCGRVLRQWGEQLIGIYGITLLFLVCCATGWSMITKISWFHIFEWLGLFCEHCGLRLLKWMGAKKDQKISTATLSIEPTDPLLSRLPRFFSGGETSSLASLSPKHEADIQELTTSTPASAGSSWQDRVEDVVALEPFKDSLSSFWNNIKVPFKPANEKKQTELASESPRRIEPILKSSPAPCADIPSEHHETAAQKVEPSPEEVEPMNNEPEDSEEKQVISPRSDTVTPPLSLAKNTSDIPAPPVILRESSGQTSHLPPLHLLDRAEPSVQSESPEKLEGMARLIESKLREFGVNVCVVTWNPGPVITRFEIEPASGIKGSQIVNLVKDLARALSVVSIRVVETIPGRNTMGLEIPNAKRQIVRLSSILEGNLYQEAQSRLTLAMGQDIAGNPQIADLAKMPHALVAGTTGSGKSVAINAMILSLLFKATPEEVRLILIDPKMLELSVYEGIPHLLSPVVTDMKLAAHALNWCVGEMERRYRLMSQLGVRNLAGYNQKILHGKQIGTPITNPATLTPDSPEPLDTMPMIVVVIDELADLMMVAGKKIEELIARLAQKARAAGIHLILATQRPSVDVITGLIKANVPTRVAFQVSSKIDSRTILDQMGAEALLGQGDMLYLPPGTGFTQRLHGAFVADPEVHRVVEYWKTQGEPNYVEGILEPEESLAIEGGSTEGSEEDPLYDEAVAIVIKNRRASISLVQRQLRIGYNRAARLIEQMESAGLVSSMQSNGNREVLAPPPL